MEFEYKDVYEFQEKHRTREERERVLLTMRSDEIMHLAHSCGCLTGAIYYGKFARLARQRESGGGG